MRGIAHALKATLVMAFYAWSVLSLPAWVYFLYRAAKTDHWAYFIVGFFVPPLSAVGGVLAWFGLILQPAPPVDQDAEFRARQAQETVTTFGSLAIVIRRCGWTEFTPADVGAADRIETNGLKDLHDGYGFTDDDIAAGKQAIAKVAADVNCGDAQVREKARRVLDGVRAMAR